MACECERVIVCVPCCQQVGRRGSWSQDHEGRASLQLIVPVPHRPASLPLPDPPLKAACGEGRVAPVRAVEVLSQQYFFTSPRLAALSTQAEILAQVMS